LGKKDFRNKNLDLLQSTHHLLNLGLDSSLVEEKVPRSGFFLKKIEKNNSDAVAPPVWAEHHRAGDDELAGEDEDCSSSFFLKL
jgi:hypothetical protein